MHGEVVKGTRKVGRSTGKASKALDPEVVMAGPEVARASSEYNRCLF